MQTSIHQERLKGISLWQPWASSMAMGLKKIETRGYLTHYRGDLVICSAKVKPKREYFSTEAQYLESLTFPYGFALCVVDLYDCRPTSELKNLRQPLSALELSMGNYEDGRFGWITRNLRTLKTPVPVSGKQGFFFITGVAMDKIKEQL